MSFLVLLKHRKFRKYLNTYHENRKTIKSIIIRTKRTSRLQQGQRDKFRVVLNNMYSDHERLHTVYFQRSKMKKRKKEITVKLY